MIFQFGVGNWGKNHRRIISELGFPWTSTDLDDFPFATLKRMNPSKDIAVVTCSTINHFPIILRCLVRGIPVFCEKPICTTREQINILSNYVDKESSFFMAGHQLVFLPELKEIRSKQIKHCTSMRTGAIPRTEGGILSLGVHDLSVFNYVTGESKWEILSAQGSKHESHICLLSHKKNISAEMYISSFSDLRLRHSTFSSGSKIYSIVPDNWNRLDLLKKELTYFFRCVHANHPIKINTLADTVSIMKTLFDIEDAL